MRTPSHRHMVSGAVAALTAVACVSTSFAAAPARAAAAPLSQAPRAAASTPLVFPGNDGKQHEVTWDKHSFKVDGEPLSIWSGEFHYRRSPSPQA